MPIRLAKEIMHGMDEIEEFCEGQGGEMDNRTCTINEETYTGGQRMELMVYRTLGDNVGMKISRRREQGEMISDEVLEEHSVVVEPDSIEGDEDHLSFRSALPRARKYTIFDVDDIEIKESLDSNEALPSMMRGVSPEK